MNDFKSKYGPWAMVAGASEGLGAAWAEALANRGLNLVLIARRREKLEELAAVLKEKYSVEIICHAADLSDFDPVRQFVSTLDVPVGLLVYNAAFATIGPFSDIPEEDLSRIVDVNIRGPLLLTRLLVPAMMARGRGGIILMSSLAGGQGSPKIATYAASKAFNTILAEGIWKELKGHGIDVLATRAGAIRTPAYQDASSSKDAPGTLDPGEVVEAALKGLGRGPVTIPGFTNKLANVFMSRLFTRKTAISIMDNNTKNLT